jgi:hypothetical protein
MNWRLFLVGVGIAAAGAFVGFGSGWNLAIEQQKRSIVSAPTTIGPLGPDDSWVIKRMLDADKVCGPVPFELKATRDEFTLVCGRPERVRPLKMPKPLIGG